MGGTNHALQGHTGYRCCTAARRRAAADHSLQQRDRRRHRGSATAPAAAGHSGAQAKPSAATLAVLPADGSQNVAPNGAVKVSVTDGKLTQVTVTGPDGKPVAGTVDPDGSWVPTAALAVSTKYQVNANAVDASGVATTTTSSFSTLTPSKTEKVRDNLDSNATYGVGMIISVTFDKAVTNQQAAEQAITVEATDGTTVKGHWFGPNRLDLRPENYWKPGTKVTVHRRVSGVELSPASTATRTPTRPSPSAARRSARRTPAPTR